MTLYKYETKVRGEKVIAGQPIVLAEHLTFHGISFTSLPSNSAPSPILLPLFLFRFLGHCRAREIQQYAHFLLSPSTCLHTRELSLCNTNVGGSSIYTYNMHYAVAIPVGRLALFLETMLYIALVILCCYVIRAALLYSWSDCGNTYGGLNLTSSK